MKGSVVNPKSYTSNYLQEVQKIASLLDVGMIEKMVQILLKIRESGGRLFILGVGGGAGNAGHAVNDFRKIVNLESYSPTDNVSELTARVNDEGWETSFSNWLLGSRLNEKDGIFVFSVGGGNPSKKISQNIVSALHLAKERRAAVLGIVGRDGGYTAEVADACVIIPPINPENVTTHTEAFQMVVHHLIVGHPSLKANEMKWESVK